MKGRLGSVICIFTFSLLLGSQSAFAASVPVPNTIILGTNVFSGPSFIVSGNFDPSDTIDLTASGTVDLASGSFTANAAGVIISPDTTNTGHHPGETAPGPGGFPFAALMISKNGGAFVPFFPADATTGLGDPTPPTTISASRTLNDLFGMGLSDGDTIEFRVNDSNTGDNSGQYDISQTETEPEPEPVVGGELLPIDSTSLLLAGLQSSAIWVLPVLAGATGVGIAAFKLRRK